MMAGRIQAMFSGLPGRRKKAFIPFLVVGDPDPTTFIEIIALIELEADIVELGIPYTDPVADGPVIQAADERALESGTRLSNALDLIERVRAMTIKPIVILTYANVIGTGERKKRTIQELAKRGVDGIIIADAPLEESETFESEIESHNMTLVRLVAPTTNDDRLRHIIEKSTGFIYLVAVKGVTGTRTTIQQETMDLIVRIKASLRDGRTIPVCVGFGISTPGHVKELVNLGVDGVIVGSAIVKIIEENLDNTQIMKQKLVEFVIRMNEATRA
nr:tryptophan synthase subunit alpha [Candidatus Sigynarchaeota archaeon]